MILIFLFYRQSPNGKESNNYSSRHGEHSYSSSSSSSSSSNSNDVSFENDKSSHENSFNFNINTANQFELVELNKTNYVNLVQNSPKGYRTILLIVNKENKSQLTNLFKQVACKYIK